MRSNLVVRPAVPADARAIADVHQRGWIQAHQPGVDPAATPLSPERLSRWHARLEGRGEALTSVVELDGTIAGFVSVGPCRDADVPAGTAEIFAIYVDPNRQRRACGRALFADAVRWAQAMESARLVLWVSAANSRACAFYEAMGMRPDGASKEKESGGLVLSEVRYSVARTSALRA